MEKIASFCIDHDKLLPGIYISRIDGDIVTPDIRRSYTNVTPHSANAVLHTIEHLFATFARNGECREQVIYFGPMGCRTGFYFLVRNMDHKKVIRLIKDAFAFIADFEGMIPGATAKECGNYLEHDLEGARKEAREFLPKIEGWNEEKLRYLS